MTTVKVCGNHEVEFYSGKCGPCTDRSLLERALPWLEEYTKLFVARDVVSLRSLIAEIKEQIEK